MASYRSSFQNFHDGNMLASKPNLRTLFGFSLPSSFSLPKLRFLRVLRVKDSSLTNFSRAISGCMHLRYLGLRRCGDVTHPSSIGQFLYLQTINLRKTRLESGVPNSLWNIPTLRHVYLNQGFSAPRNRPQKKLESFYLYVQVDEDNKYLANENTVDFLGQMTQLTTLKLISPSGLPIEMIHLLTNMTFLVEVTLAWFTLLDKLPESQLLPQGLRKLHLFAETIKEDPMPILEKLPYLVVLMLSGYQGRTMLCSAKGFPRLQELELVDFSIGFRNLKKLPEGLVHLPSLKELELRYMYRISEDDVTRKELEGRGCKVKVTVQFLMEPVLPGHLVVTHAWPNNCP